MYGLELKKKSWKLSNMKVRMVPSMVEAGEGAGDRDGLTEGVEVIDKVPLPKLGSGRRAVCFIII